MKIKLWVSLVLAFFAFVFITQNTDTAYVRFLVWSLEMSLVLLVFIMLGAGVIIGWLLNSYFRYSIKKNRERQDGQKDSESADHPVQEFAANPQDEINIEKNKEKVNNE